MIPLSLNGGSQETNTTELVEAAALTPAGGPGTGFSKKNNIIQGEEALEKTPCVLQSKRPTASNM